MIRIKINKLKEATEKELSHPAKSADAGVIQDNIKFFNNNKELKDMLTENTPLSVEEIVPKIEPFRMNKITKYLGGGALGKAFLLSNNHAVKLFRGGVDTQDDIKMYREAYEKMHSGKATKFTLPVFYFNEVPATDLKSKFPLYYAEMSKVIPFDDFLRDRPDRKETPGRDTKDDWKTKFSRPEVADFLIRFFVNTINGVGKWYHTVDLDLTHLVGQKDFIDKFLSHIDEYGKQIAAKGKWELFKFDKIPEYIDDIKNYRTLSRVEIRNLIKSLLQMHLQGRKMADAGARNLGISPHSRPNDPIFYIFDK